MLPFSLPSSQAAVSCLPLPVSFRRLSGVWVGLGAPHWCGVCLVTLATTGQRCGMTFSDQRTVHRDQEVKTQSSHKPVGTFPILWPIVRVDLRTTLWIPPPLCPAQGSSPGWRLRALPQLQPSLCHHFFLSDSLSFPVSSSHLLPALPFSHPPPPNTAAVWLTLYIAAFSG